MAHTGGLKWRKLDLHVHTPDSHDFVGKKDVSAADVVKAALDAGLDGIAVTDHHSGRWVDSVKDAAKGTGLVIFPGVEIPVNAGRKGIHVIALFDVDKGTRDIEALLNKLDIMPDMYGSKDAVAKSLPDAVKLIGDLNGLAILAHCKSSKGVLGDITGAPRKQVFEQPALCGVEVSESDFTAEHKAKGTRAVDLLDGHDPNFGNRKLGVYLASDNHYLDPESGDPAGHCLAGIGSSYTYFKLDDPISLEGVRQCLADRDVRIQFPEDACGEKPSLGHTSPRIVSLSVDAGFLAGQTLDFHEALNTVIGAKGSGKSLTIEFLRFILDRPPTESHILEDHDGKLRTQLGLGGRLTVLLLDRSGSERRLVRTYDPLNGSPYEQPIMREYAKDFPAQFLSQNEIVRIAENPGLQIGFIDSFFDFSEYSTALDAIRKELEENDRLYSETLSDLSKFSQTKQRIEALKEQIADLDKALGDPECVEYFRAKSIHAAVQSQAVYLGGLASKIQAQVTAVEQSAPPKLPDDLADVGRLLKARSLADDGRQVLVKDLRAAIGKIEIVGTQVEIELTSAKANLDIAQTTYEEWAKSHGGDAAKLSQERDRLQTEFARLSLEVDGQQSKRDQLKTLMNQRGKLLSSLSTTYASYSSERQTRCATFTEKSSGKIRATVTASSDQQAFRETLTAMKKGSRLEQSEIDAVCKNVSPRVLVTRILKYHMRDDRAVEALEPIAKQSRIPLARIQKLADHLVEKCGYRELLEMQHSVQPADTPDIEVRVADGVYRRLDEVSTGQKCTAMIVMALCTGDSPICIDQPEDSLDIRTIWDDMCCTVRTAKTTRQFIFTSHSSNLAVSSDTDKYTVLVADATRATVSESGAIEGPRVKDEVILHLEGGAHAYKVKYEKYNIDLRP